jgi:uncharacterized membrane-anchored protein YhcB (DUF1043 family)
MSFIISALIGCSFGICVFVGLTLARVLRIERRMLDQRARLDAQEARLDAYQQALRGRLRGVE